MREGKEFHGEFSSGDATTAAAMTLYDDAGVAITLNTDGKDRVNVVDWQISANAAMIVDIGTGTLGAGELHFTQQLGAAGWSNGSTDQPRAFKINSMPKVKTSAAGNVKVTIGGFLTRT